MKNIEFNVIGDIYSYFGWDNVNTAFNNCLWLINKLLSPFESSNFVSYAPTISWSILLSKASFAFLLLSMFSYWLQTTFNWNKKTFFGKIPSLLMSAANITLAFLLLVRWAESGHFPLSNLYESLLFLSWSLTSMHLFLENTLEKKERKVQSSISKAGTQLTPTYPTLPPLSPVPPKSKVSLSEQKIVPALTLGAITSPLSLFTNAFATFSLPEEMQRATVLVPALQSNWLIMHVSVMIISYAALLSGSLLAMAFLVSQFVENTPFFITNELASNKRDFINKPTMADIRGLKTYVSQFFHFPKLAGLQSSVDAPIDKLKTRWTTQLSSSMVSLISDGGNVANINTLSTSNPTVCGVSQTSDLDRVSHDSFLDTPVKTLSENNTRNNALASSFNPSAPTISNTELTTSTYPYPIMEDEKSKASKSSPDNLQWFHQDCLEKVKIEPSSRLHFVANTFASTAPIPERGMQSADPKGKLYKDFPKGTNDAKARFLDQVETGVGGVQSSIISNNTAKSWPLLGEKNLPHILDNLSYRSIGLGFAFLTIGILSGAVWANEAWGSYWSWDPKETWAFVTWLVFAFYLHTRLSRGWVGEKSAYVAIFGFVVIWFCYLGVNLVGKGLHSYGWFHKVH